MTTYYYYEDATGTSDGLSEANAYDGSSTVTLPDGSSGVCDFRLVINALQSGDTLYIKKSSSPISFGSSLTPQSETTNAADHNDVDGYGYISLIGYETTPGDSGRADIDMGGATLRYRPYARYENLNITGSYGGDLFLLGAASVVRNCRFHKLANYGSCIYVGNSCYIDRCEFINDYSTASPGTGNAVINISPSASNATVKNCYIEAGNGVHGFFNTVSSLGVTIIENNIIVLNLDKNSSGNSDGSGIYFQDFTYERNAIINGNIFYNAKNALLFGVNDTRFGSATVAYNIFAQCEKVVEGTSTYPDFYFWPGYSGDTSTHASSGQLIRASNNFFYANTSNGDLPAQETPTYLTTDPFVDAANKDFTLKNPDDFGYAKNFLQAGASGDTVTRNALMNIAPFQISDSGSLSLGTGGVGDSITVSNRTYQKTQEGPIVWRRTKPSVIPTFNPRSISSMQAWWDANDYTTITTDRDSGGVFYWRDKLGNSTLSSNLSGTNSPRYSAERKLNNKNYVDFQGIDDESMSLSDANPTFGTTDLDMIPSESFTIMLVGKVEDGEYASISSEIVGTLIGKGGGWGTSGTYALGRSFKNSAGVTYDNWIMNIRGYGPSNAIENLPNYYGPADSNPHVFTSKWDGSDHELWIDGVTLSNMNTIGTASNQNREFTVGCVGGGNGTMQGLIAEVMVFDSSLSESDRNKVEGYLAHKWGLESSLPVDHPYKSSAPT